MNHLKRYILFLALFVCLLFVTSQAYASILYSNNFTSDFSDYRTDFGNCFTGLKGLSCDGINGTVSIYNTNFSLLKCIYGDFNTTGSSTIADNLIISNNNYNLGHLVNIVFTPNHNIILHSINIDTTDENNFNIGTITPIGKHTYSLCQSGTTYKVYLDNQLLITKTITGFPGGYFGFQLVPGDSLTNFTATDTLPLSLPITLNVPSLKQTDINWGTQMYDSANQWAPQHSTISDWGCALTSAAMILQYYHIDKLPDGTALNPGTLNTWLKNHKDGYINGGWINWVAIANLTHQAKVSGQDPNFVYDALEYRRSGKDDTLFSQDLQNNQPDILEEPGHFIVGTGQTTNTYTINDPYYTRTDLTQGYSNSYLSLGRYVPSHTDLSYIMAVADPSVNISLTDSNNVSTGSSYLQNPLIDDLDNTITSGNPVKIFYDPQPNSGTYFLTLSGQPNQPYSITVYLYDKDGNTLDPITLTGNFNSSGTATDIIHFDSQSVTNDQITQQVTFDTFLSDINKFQQTGDLKNGPSNALLAIAQSASKSTQKNNIIPVHVQLLAFEGLLDIFHNRGVSDTSYNLLQFDAQQLLQSQ